jgi:hypothetical protein
LNDHRRAPSLTRPLGGIGLVKSFHFPFVVRDLPPVIEERCAEQ